MKLPSSFTHTPFAARKPVARITESYGTIVTNASGAAAAAVVPNADAATVPTGSSATDPESFTDETAEDETVEDETVEDETVAGAAVGDDGAITRARSISATNRGLA